MKLFLGDAGVDLTVFTAHSTRAASTSLGNNLEMRLNPFREIKRIQREIDFMESSDFDATYKLQFPLVPLFMVSMSRLYSTFLFLQYVYYTFKNDRIKLTKGQNLEMLSNGNNKLFVLDRSINDVSPRN